MQKETGGGSGMNQGVLAAVFVGVLVIAIGFAVVLGTGMLGSGASNSSYEARITELEDNVQFLADLVAQLDPTAGTGGPRATGSFKIAYVDMFRVLEVMGTELADPDVLQALEAYEQEAARIQGEISALEQQFANGEITLQEMQAQQQELRYELDLKNLELSAPIQQMILAESTRIAQERGYAMLLDNPASKLQPIIIFSREGFVDDITQDVIEALRRE